MRSYIKRQSSANRACLSAIAAVFACAALAACVAPAPKYENGQYVPPPSKHALAISLDDKGCGESRQVMAPVVTALVGTLAPALVNYGYDQFVNWLDSKAADLSTSSSGIATTTLYNSTKTGFTLKRCLTLTRDDNLIAEFSLVPTGAIYWHMMPYSLEFKKSEAKERPDQEKSLVAEIGFATPGPEGKLTTFFQATFDLGRHKAGSGKITQFVGQDSGPAIFPMANDRDPALTIKITASIVENGEGRDWIRGVTNSLREKEHREQILKPILDAISKGTGAE